MTVKRPADVVQQRIREGKGVFVTPEERESVDMHLLQQLGGKVPNKAKPPEDEIKRTRMSRVCAILAPFVVGVAVGFVLATARVVPRLGIILGGSGGSSGWSR